MSHSYTNPSEKQDLAHVESSQHESEELDEHGFTKRKPIINPTIMDKHAVFSVKRLL